MLVKGAPGHCKNMSFDELNIRPLGVFLEINITPYQSRSIPVQFLSIPL